LDRIALNALREVRLTAGFFVALAAGNSESWETSDNSGRRAFPT
jgi:hypothetical protein